VIPEQLERIHRRENQTCLTSIQTTNLLKYFLLIIREGTEVALHAEMTLTDSVRIAVVTLALVACGKDSTSESACLYASKPYAEGARMCQDNRHWMQCTADERGPRWHDTNEPCRE
jgi:hypothetical protein